MDMTTAAGQIAPAGKLESQKILNGKICTSLMETVEFNNKK